MPGLDYSAARLSGGAIRAAGYDFAIRYVGTPERTKNIAPFEYNDLLANGVAVALVYENVAEDALGGFPAGQAAARAARADADSIGFPANRPIYFAVDWVATAAQMPAVMAYLDGAASVLGVEHVGVYGFQLTIRMAMDGGHAHWFWQCGAISALVPGTHLYQHNNDNTHVSGTTCDVNDALAADFGQYPGGDDMTPDESAMLADIHEQLCGGGSRTPGAYPGWATKDGTPRSLTAIDLLREAHGETTKRLPNRVDGKSSDTVLGYALNADAYGYKVTQQVAALTAKVDAVQGALTQEEAHLLAALKGLTAGAVDVRALAAALVPLLPQTVTVDQITAAFAAKLGVTK